MRRTPRTALPALGLFALLLAAGPALSATFQGKNVDGRRHQASILNNDFGQYDVEVKFHDDHAYAYFHGGARIVLILEDEEITDPHRIPAHDPRRGVTWEINVKDLGGR